MPVSWVSTFTATGSALPIAYARETGSRKRFARLTLSQNNRLAECVCWNDYYMEHRTEIQSLKDRVVILTAVIRYSDYNGCNTLQTYKNSLLFIQS